MAKYNDLTTGQSEACINRLGGWDNFLRFIGGQGKVVFETILTFIRTVSLPAQPATTTSKKFWEDAGVKWMGSNFQAHCLGVLVEASDPLVVAVHKLEEGSVDGHILAERGEKARVPLSQISAFLAANKESSEWFIFYPEELPDWAVSAGWRAAYCGWFVSASSVESPSMWGAGGRVVSRN